MAHESNKLTQSHVKKEINCSDNEVPIVFDRLTQDGQDQCHPLTAIIVRITLYDYLSHH